MLEKKLSNRSRAEPGLNLFRKGALMARDSAVCSLVIPVRNFWFRPEAMSQVLQAGKRKSFCMSKLDYVDTCPVEHAVIFYTVKLFEKEVDYPLAG